MNRQLIALAIAITAVIVATTGAISQSRIIEMGITSSEMASYFQQHAGANDIARVDHPNDIGLISGISVGKKMVIFKSAAQIQQFLASNAGALDIVGYNLEPGQQNDPAELANPVAAAQSVKTLAQQYGKQVAIGLTHDLTLKYGAAMAPFADLWVLQIQKAQNDPAMASEFVNQMVPALTKANPAIQVFVQIRTDTSPAALVKLVNGLGPVNVSILTQRQDVQDAINVASQFFGSSSQQAPANFQPLQMPGNSEYGIRIPAKLNGWYAPTASNLIGSDERDHAGRGAVIAWDWSTAYGSPVFAIGPGVVRYAGCNDAGHYGCWVSSGHENGLQSDYAHCATNSIRVQAGQQVDASTQLCNVGNTGWTDWAHVHLAIKLNGAPQRIDQFFDRSLIAYCHWTKCKATNDPNAPVAGMGRTPTQQQATAPAMTENRLTQLLRTLAQMPAEQLANAVFLATIGIGLVIWLGGMWIRIIVVSAGAAMAGALTIAILLLPVSVQPIQAGQQTATVGGDWEKAYQIVQGNEGWQCTNDGDYTMGGVTQGTYNRWRRLHGMGNADVCANLTREQAKLVFRDLFWTPSGADKMEWALALTVVDHYYNTGAVKHLLAQCGSDVACFNNARIADYKTKGNCNLYCVAWINRVNKIRKFTGG